MRRPRAGGRCAALAGATLVLTTAVGCSSPITATRLEAAFGPTFARLYTLQQQETGRALPPRGPDGEAHCGRGGAVTGGSGAGDDWTCNVVYPFGDGHLQPITYDVTVAATGCYTADGPSAVVGRAQLTTTAGVTVVNPLFAIDGCLHLT